MTISPTACEEKTLKVQESRSRFLESAEQGILKHAVSKQYGGHGDGFKELCKAHEAFGRSSRDSGIILALNAHLWGTVFPLLQHGNEEQKQKYFPGLLNGTLIGGHAITEPQAGSDLEAMQCKADVIDQGYRISGHKRYITNAPIADMLTIYAKLEGKTSAFIVHSNDAGAVFTNTPAVSACATATMGDVVFDDCFVNKERLLGKPGSGQFIIQQALELERAFVFSGLLGIMSWQLDSVINHSRQRLVEGKPLGHKQAISHRIADMKTRLDSARLWLQHCARLKDAGQRLTLASAQTKLFASEAFLQSSLDAVHIFGASGLVKGNPMAQLVQDAMASRLFSGSSEIQKNIIAALLGTGETYRKPISR